MSIPKIFHQQTPPLKVFHLEFYSIAQNYFHPHFQQVTQVCFQSSICVQNVFDVFVPTTILALQTKPSSPSWRLLLYPLANCSYSSPPVTKNIFSLNVSHNFVSFMMNLLGCINVLLPPAPKFIANVSSVSYNISPLSGTLLG